MEFEEIAKALEGEFGPDALVRGEPNRVDVRIDEDRTVSFVAEPASHEIVLFAEIGEIPDIGSEDFYEQALKANWLFKGGAGAVIAINPETNGLSLNCTHPMNALDGETFLVLTRSFVTTYGLWFQFACAWVDALMERLVEREGGGAGEGGGAADALPSAGDLFMNLRNDFIRC